MSLKFKLNKPIVSKKDTLHNFGNVTGTFVLKAFSDICKYDVYIDKVKQDKIEFLSLNNQQLEVRPISKDASSVFAVNSVLKFHNVDSLSTELVSNCYYEIDQIDCNFIVSFNIKETVRIYLKVGDRVLVDNLTNYCEIEWLANSPTLLLIESPSNSQVPILLRRV